MSPLRSCPICFQKKPSNEFPRLRNGRRGRFCDECRPLDVAAEMNVIQQAADFVEGRAEATPCAECKMQIGVLFYRKDGKCCDVHGMAQSGTSTWFLRRLISQLTPLCHACATKQTPRAKHSKFAEVFKAKAIREPDEEKRQKYWSMHYHFKNAERLND